MADARTEPSPLWPARATATVVLAGAVLFLALELSGAQGPGFPPQLACHLVAGLAAALVLAASRSRAGRHRAEALAPALSAVVGVAALVYVRLVPAAAGVVASVLVSLLVGTTVVAAWSVERTVAAGVLAGLGFAAAGLRGGGPTASLAFALASLAVGAAVAVACATGLARVRAGLAHRQRELADLSARLMATHEDERQRLSRELHDELGQSLTAVLSYLWLIERQVPESTSELRGRVAEARRLASGTLAQIRELSQRLRPSVLDDYGLVPSLEAQVRAFGDRQAIVTTFHADALPQRLSSAIETAVFRITQEALGNVARHARARHVHVSLGVEGRELTLEVHDDGVGMPATRATADVGAGMGLIGIRERVRALGGRLSLASEHGARLEVRLPLPPDAELPAA